MTSSATLVLMVFGLLAISSIHGSLTDEDKSKIHAELFPVVIECTKQHGVSQDTFTVAKESGQLGQIDPCLMACVFKKIKMIDEKGLLDTDAAEQLIGKYITHDDDKTKLAEVIKKCESVNHQEVTDGEKGCERSRLIYECYLPFRGELKLTR